MGEVGDVERVREKIVEVIEKVMVKGKGRAADVDADLGGVWFVWRRRPQREEEVGIRARRQSRALFVSYRWLVFF